MSEAKLVSAISALSAALSEAGLGGVTISITAPAVNVVTNTLVVNESEATTGRRGRGAAADEAKKDEAKSDAKEEDKEEKTTGGRGRGRGAAAKENADAGTENKGRRGRGAAKKDEPKPIEDNADQADTRARLVQDLHFLADHDECIDDVTAALANTGATSIKAVPSDLLDELDEAIGAIFDKYNLN